MCNKIMAFLKQSDEQNPAIYPESARQMLKKLFLIALICRLNVIWSLK